MLGVALERALSSGSSGQKVPCGGLRSGGVRTCTENVEVFKRSLEAEGSVGPDRQLKKIEG